MKIKWILSIVLILTSGCNEEEWIFEEMITYPSGNLQVVKAFPATSSTYYVIYEFWDNQNLMSITEYFNDTINGIKSSYYIDERLKSVELYKRGKPYGDSKSYYENGQLRQYTKREKGMILSNRRYYENGYIGTNDKFINGRKVYTTFYHRSTGEKYMEGEYRYNKRINKWNIYDSLGNLIDHQEYGDPVGDRIKAAKAAKDSLANR